MPGAAEDSANTARVRTRQGCLTCRKRRRKCDEHKPTCQNCINRGLNCRYGVQLTFLKTNTFSRLPDEAQTLPESRTGTYKKLKFVVGLNDRSTPFDSCRLGTDGPNVENHSLPENPVESPDSLPASEEWQIGTGRNTLSRDSTPTGPHNLDQAHGDRIISIHRNPPNERPSAEIVNQVPLVPVSIPQANSSAYLLDETGPERDVEHPMTAEPRSSFTAISLLQDKPFTTRHYLQPPQTSGHVTTPISSNPIGYYFTRHIDDYRNEEILKYYIDEVAPWLDTCTAECSFGIHLPILAKQSRPLFEAIRALTYCQISLLPTSRDANIPQSTEVTRHAIASVESGMYSNSEEAVAACILLTISEIMPYNVNDWHRALGDRINSFASLNIHGYLTGYQGSVSWVLLRLDLAYSLFCQTPLMTQVELWHDLSYPFLYGDSHHPEQSDSKTSEWTSHSIFICAHAARYQFSPSDSWSTMPQTEHAERWTCLWSLAQWWSHHHSPQMYPILTSAISHIASDKTSAFPIIIHTRRSNLLASIMYHTASLLLLQTKPPVLRQTPKLRTPAWYATQICGLCISNGAQWSSDPVIIAALVYAGRLISYQEQRSELEDFLLRVTNECSWRFREQIEEMLEGWRADDSI
ncbi:hypothetical protein B0O99DRAFT_183972 [Bisporella sp. PMI_857]|nr:hypothetical protein B0O99DRAFT_183972 [Bisporella sp. PMI_857]